jgi:regulator of replication initiation timing
VEAIKEIGTLKQSLMKLVNEKQVLWDEIDALRAERTELEAKMWRMR